MPLLPSPLERLIVATDATLAPLRLYLRNRRARIRRAAIAELPKPASILGRDVGVEHLGCWVVIPGRPTEAGPRIVHEPSLIARGGRLVGFDADTAPERSPSTRILIIQAGPKTSGVSVRVDETVIVAPRDWS